MPVRFENFDHSFMRPDGKPVYKPSKLGREIGYDIKGQVEAVVNFDPFVYHFRPGGHVTALHGHRDHKFFARVDIERFFYNIARNRVARALSGIGLARSEHYAKWSCVKNPYAEPSYSLPYGFVQSPILATLVLMTSQVGDFLRAIPAHLATSVYMDDICLSGNDADQLQTAFAGLVASLEGANFRINGNKTRSPAPHIDLFNCDLTYARAAVREDRRAEFYSEDRSGPSQLAFERYCLSVERGNVET